MITPPCLRNHGGAAGPDHRMRVEIDDRAVMGLFRLLDRQAVEQRTGIVDEPVDPAEMPAGLLDGRTHGIMPGHVASHEESVTTCMLDGARDLLGRVPAGVVVHADERTLLA